MSQRNSDANDPFSAWFTLYGSNLEIWSRTLAEMINTEAVSQALGTYFDNYLATSEPFRKVPEQYLEFWLNSMNMPSREEIARLGTRIEGLETQLHDAPAAQTAATPDHLKELDARLAQIEAAVGEQAARLATLVAGQQERAQQRDALLKTLDSNAERMTSTLREQIEQLAVAIKGQEARLTELDSRLSALGDKLEPLGQLGGQGQRLNELETRLTALGDKLEPLGQLGGQGERLDQLETRLTALGDKLEPLGQLGGQSERLDQLETRLTDLDSKIDQVVNLLHEHDSHTAMPAGNGQTQAAELEARVTMLDQKAQELLHLVKELG